MRRAGVVVPMMLGLALAACGGDTVAPVGASTLAAKDGDGQTAAAGAALGQPLRVTVLDAGGQPVAGVAVQWMVVAGGGTLSAPSSTTDASGIASIDFILGASAGTQQVQAAASGLTGSPVTFSETATGSGPSASTITVASGGNNVPERFGSDLWVHGNYAYTGTWGARGAVTGNVVKVWSLNAGGAPALVDSLKVTGVTTISDVEVSDDGSLLLATTENGSGSGLYLYSLADPAQPVPAGSYGVAAAGGLHTGTFASINGHRYVFAARDPASHDPGVMIFDVTVPGNITLAKTIPVPEHYGAHDQFVRDGLLFSFIWDEGFRIYDVGNGMSGGSPANPVLVGSLITSAQGGDSPEAHNGWWFHNPNTGEKRYLFVGQEAPGSIGSSSSGNIHVVDVSNLAGPVEVAFYHMPGAGAHNFWMDEQKQVLYAAYYNGGVVALDVSGTLSGDLAGREIARIQPGGAGHTYVWGVQLANGSLYASDMVSGLWQLSLNGPAFH